MPREYGLVVPWQRAWGQALYGPSGFFTTGAGPSGHFRTAVHAAPGPLARALARLADATGRCRVLDVGAGHGELLAALTALPDAAHLALHAVDVVARPAGLPAGIGWSQGLHEIPADAFDDALVIGWELLDDVPCPVLELDEDGAPRTVLVDPRTGREALGPDPAPAELAWCRRWWPFEDGDPGDRVEVGLPRDLLWAGLAERAAATAGGATLLAVDYHHERADRPATGTLTGFRGGRAVPPVPDGSCDVTAHVALDAVAAAAQAAGATDTRLTDQRTALTELGVREGLAGPAAHALPAGGAGLLQALARRSAVAELLDPGALGGFGWLVQRVAGRCG
ncbi:MAG TPA: SAM-dependent methyltransferase [Kineosporiaceae bacterium]